MIVYYAVKFHEDMSNRAHIESVLSVLEKAGLDSVCFVRDIEKWGGCRIEDAHELMSLAFSAIDASDAVIVDANEKGVGLGIEAGYAYARGIPVINIARAGADVPTTLRGISRVLQYEDTTDLTQHIRELVRELSQRMQVPVR